MYKKIREEVGFTFIDTFIEILLYTTTIINKMQTGGVIINSHTDTKINDNLLLGKLKIKFTLQRAKLILHFVIFITKNKATIL